MSDPLRDRVSAAFGTLYDIEREIGRGGMGVVYRAVDRKLRRKVAIKVLPPELAFRDDVKQRFLREAQTAAQLAHPHIVPIYAVEEREGIVCFVMALVDGESVAARIARERQLPIVDVQRTLLQVADALSFAHSRGVVHRDIKPDNILIDPTDGRAMVTDFGIARAAEGDVRLTMTGVAVGTPAYMSPEQASGDREIDGRSDLYSLAIVGYQMLAGELPFRASNTPSMLMKHISETAAPLLGFRPDVPAAMLTALERAMAKKPDDRFSTAEEFREAIVRPAPRLAEPPIESRRIPGSEDPQLRMSAQWKHPVPRSAIDAAGAGAGTDGRSRHLGDSVRDAIDAANAGRDAAAASRRSSLPVPLRPNAVAPIPSFMPATWNDARRGWQAAPSVAKRRRDGRESIEAFSKRPMHERIVHLRREAAGYAATIAMLAGINILTSPEFAWFLFPAFGMSLRWARRAGSLWAEGVRMKDIFGAAAVKGIATAKEHAAVSSGRPADHAAKLAPPDVLAGPHGHIVMRAANDKHTIHESVIKLSKADRDLIPDVIPTVDALAERIGSLALALHRLDEDVRPEAMRALEERIAATRSQPETKERDQRLQLLERQESTMRDLTARRETLFTQLEGAGLVLQNMRLDLIALRSAGVQSVLNDMSSATQEARAMSRDIGHVLDAAKEVR